MLFPTHLVAAYGLARRWSVSPRLLVIGAALPDLIDKPMGMIGLLPLYQSIGHSLLALVGLAAIVSIRRAWTPVWLGWASHLALDALHLLVNGRSADLVFLAWPFIDYRPGINLPPLEFLAHYVGTPSFYLELPIWITVGLIVYRDHERD